MKRGNASDLVYRAIVDHMETTDVAPTIRELQTATGLSSTSVVAYNLGLLERQGRIQRGPKGSFRTIRITGEQVPLIAIEGKRIALRIIQNAVQVSPESDRTMVVDAALLFQLQRWTERVGA